MFDSFSGGVYMCFFTVFVFMPDFVQSVNVPYVNVSNFMFLMVSVFFSIKNNEVFGKSQKIGNIPWSDDLC